MRKSRKRVDWQLDLPARLLVAGKIGRHPLKRTVIKNPIWSGFRDGFSPGTHSESGFGFECTVPLGKELCSDVWS